MISKITSTEIKAKNPLISVIIPCFNSDNFIRESINSVLNQTYKNIEIIVIDDGSVDTTLSILQEYSGFLTILNQNNSGAGSARNAGLRASNGEYIAFLDSDDYWDPDKIRKQLNLMLHEKLDLVYCGGKTIEKNLNETILVPKFRGNCYKYFIRYPTTAIILLGCSSAVFRKSILVSSGNFDPSFKGAAEDWDFFRRVCIYAKVGFVNESLVGYRLHENNVSRRGFKDFFTGNRRAVRKMIKEDSSLSVKTKTRIVVSFYSIAVKSLFKSFLEITR
jgi:glycosyltransferase involved in cell wall biosynthesis